MEVSLKRSRAVAAVLSLALIAGACGGRDEVSSGSEDIEATVRASIKAENEGDTGAFLALWTDKGLESYDSGSREEIKAGGEDSSFGEDKIDIVSFTNTKAESEEGTTTIDIAMAEAKVVKALFRADFKLIKKNDKWLIDGFEFKGSPEPKSGTKVVDIKGQDYAFLIDTTEVPADVAFSFENIGKEQHEITIFKGPDGVDIATAKKALENVDGSELEDIPAGYTADHLTFADIGETVPVAFSEDLKPGTYVLACYIPQGGFGDDGPVNPEGKPHIQLGMINTLTVK